MGPKVATLSALVLAISTLALPSSENLQRRHEYIDPTGQNPSIEITVPLNTLACHTPASEMPPRWTLAKPIPRFRLPSTFSFASWCTNGGGDPIQLSPAASDLSLYPGLSEKWIGVGTRNEIYGSAQYGSGFGTYSRQDGKLSYDPDLTLNLTHWTRSLAFGFPPIPWAGYRGGDEMRKAWEGYSPGIGVTNAVSGPGVGVNAGLIAMKNGDQRQRWDILGDAATLNILAEVLERSTDKGGCGAEAMPVQDVVYADVNNTFPRPDNPDSYPYVHSMGMIYAFQIFLHPWNIVQYYRGSSVAIGNSTYDNAFAHHNVTNSDYWAATPLNTTGVDMEFFHCLNRTIAGVIPIVDPTVVLHYRKTPGQIAGIVVGTVLPVLLIVAAAIFWFVRRQKAQKAEAKMVAAARLGAETPDKSSIMKSKEKIPLDPQTIAQ
ncbi:hypothetical protein FRC17_009329 [Serendipita sp. 399]|nr:hypothetical protein FRC17_009329 [Serendipita sp. 399]